MLEDSGFLQTMLQTLKYLSSWMKIVVSVYVTLGYIFKKIQFVDNYRHTTVFGSIF